MEKQLESGFQRLRGNVGRTQYFALGFGCIIGSGWVVIAGDWLEAAGPGGAILGFLLGGAVIALVGACYAELTSQVPEAGSEFAYARRVFGERTAFAVGWFLLLYFIAVAVFEGLALAWIFELIWPLTRSADLYTTFGQQVPLGAIVIGATVAIAIAAINFLGVGAAARLQSVLTYGFLAVAIALLGWLIPLGSFENAQPLFKGPGDTPWYYGTLWIFATCAFLLNGFQAIPQVVEERSSSVSLAHVAGLIVVSIVAGVAFYCFVILANSVAVPWTKLAGTEMATVTAVKTLPWGNQLAVVLLLAAAASLIKTWNGMVMMAARLMVAMARAGALPASFATLDQRFGSPARALLFIAIMNVAGLLLGRGAIIPIINMCSMTLTLTFIMCCTAVILLRRRGGAPAPFTVPGGTSVILLTLLAATAMAITAFASPIFNNPGSIPTEYILLVVWSAAGAVFAWLTVKSRGNRVVAEGRV